ncbi:MAG: hypothetical protein RL026_1295 [Pseudomonadota bacterium]|jgi:phytoene synthase
MMHMAMESPDQVLARHGRSFHWARHLFGRREAALATRLYAFCRSLDDIADGDLADAEALRRLAAVRIALTGGPADEPWLRDFLELMAECGIDPGVPLWLLDTLEADRDAPCLPDRPALLRYCHGAAGTVGLMMARILGCQSAQGLQHAVDLGIAMQLTNICRDVIEDAQRGRRYVPADLVGMLPPARLLGLRADERAPVATAIRALLALADRYYASGLEGLCWLPWRTRFGVAVAAFVYRGIGRELAHRRHDAWAGRARVGGLRKFGLTLAALGCVLRRAWRAPARRRHDPSLHAPLQGLPGVEPANATMATGLR